MTTHNGRTQRGDDLPGEGQVRADFSMTTARGARMSLHGIFTAQVAFGAWAAMSVDQQSAAPIAGDDAPTAADRAPTSLPGDARECLQDVVSHFDNIVSGLEAKRATALEHRDRDDAAYWEREISVIQRMRDQAVRSLADAGYPRKEYGAPVSHLRTSPSAQAA